MGCWSNAEGKEGQAWQGPESKVKGRSAPLARTDEKVRQVGSCFRDLGSCQHLSSNFDFTSSVAQPSAPNSIRQRVLTERVLLLSRTLGTSKS